MAGTTYHPKDTLIQMFKTLCDAHKDKASYVSIGKSYQGRDMWLFRIGNPNGGRVSFDGSLHGWEDLGSECEYYYARWLLESGETEALRILNNNWTLIVPIVNMDSSERTNMDFSNCADGVDLNRNWKQGWTLKTCAAAHVDQTYPGTTYWTEAEVLSMLSYFTAYRPKCHVNTHFGGGPYLAYYNLESATVAQRINARARALTPPLPSDVPYEILFNYMGPNSVCPYDLRTVAASGMEYGDLHNLGIFSWILETCGNVPPADTSAAYEHRWPTPHFVQELFYPGLRAIFQAMSNEFEDPAAQWPATLVKGLVPPVIPLCVVEIPHAV